MQTQRLFALPVQSCSRFCPTSLSAASGYASTVCRFSSCSTVTFPFPGWPDLRGGGEGHTGWLGTLWTGTAWHRQHCRQSPCRDATSKLPIRTPAPPGSLPKGWARAPAPSFPLTDTHSPTSPQTGAWKQAPVVKEEIHFFLPLLLKPPSTPAPGPPSPRILN